MRDSKKLRSVQAILFDMDGVLIESSRAWYYTMNLILEKHRLPKISWNVFLKHLGQSIEKDVETFFKMLTVEQLKQLYIEHFPRFIDLIDPMPGAKNVLKKINRFGLKTGCVTNTPKTLALKILKNFELLDFLGVVICGDEVSLQKPHPEPILRALSTLRVSPEKACFVGDTIYDIEAANRAGCIPIGLKVESDIKINSLRELIHLLGLKSL